MSKNSAALQGWVKSTDLKSGRVFFANHITRKTQWDPPEGWVEQEIQAPLALPLADSNASPTAAAANEEPLPSNWEVMHDPTTGKPFYVDHERKITTWTRPVEEKKKTLPVSLRPAVATPPTSSNSAAVARILQQQQEQQSSYQNSSGTSRSYQQEAAYYQPTAQTDVDLSDSMPSLGFTVKKVADALRPNCPHCDALFTMSKRRHHCRLCGDVFCDPCSAHRVTLPLEGPEFEKPVRICDFCFKDVDQGNFFSMRRYLTPLHLYEEGVEEEEGGVATPSNVNAALSGLTNDLDQMVHNAVSLEEKVTIPPKILVPEITKHLKQHSTANRAIRALASLMALESIAGKQDFAVAVYVYGKKPVMEDILSVLERSGSDRKTLYVQEQAARALFYITDGQTISALTRTLSELESHREDGESFGDVNALDINRAIRSMLDHSSNIKNPNLQRWSAACIKRLVMEDQRRACMAVNDVAAVVASGGEPPPLSYQSFLDDMVNTGGVMILCSLIGADDADTRAHAVGALGATLQSTRAIDASMTALYEMTGGIAGRTTSKDGAIVRAIVAGGGCAGSVSQLLLSADNAVAGMGCSFLASLVMPLISDPQASASLTYNYDYQNDEGGMGACREAAVEIATGSCLPSLFSLVRERGSVSRPIELRKVGMEALAAVVLTIGEMGKMWAQGQYEEGLERAGAPGKLKEAIILLNQEGAIDVALELLQSASGQSLGSGRETPSSRIRESAGLILGSISSCSAKAVMELQTRQILSSLLLASNDDSMTVASTLRGDAAPRCLGILETVSSILMFTWQHPSGASSELLDRLIEAIDAGAISYVSKVLNTKIDWESKDKAAGGMKGRAASCRFLCCLFGIALTDDTGIGMRRLMDAVDSDAHSYRGGERSPSNIIEATLGVLQNASNQARKALMGSITQGPHYQNALMDLVDAALLAAGSMCGSSVAPGGSEGTMITGANFLATRNDSYVSRRTGICTVACDVVVKKGRSSPALLPTMLVGGFGEASLLSSLRLALAIAQNGSKEQHAKLALSGILVPVGDSLRTALSRGDLYKFSAALALVRFCGPHVAAGQGGGIESVRDAIKVATNVLTLPINPDSTVEQFQTQEALKAECISALESLSRNASLRSAISTDALPSMIRYLHSSSRLSSGDDRSQGTQCAALRAVLQIVQVPSHAVSAAEAGIAESLGGLLASGDFRSQEDEVSMLALEVLHVIASNDQARGKAKLLETGLVRSICAALGKSTTAQAKKPTDSRADVTYLGLEILHFVLSDIDSRGPTQTILQSPAAIAFLDSVASESKFVKAMCSTLLLKTSMKLPRHDSDTSGESEFDIPKVYGAPLILVQEKCGGHDNTHSASSAILFTVAVYACAIESNRSQVFWKAALLQDRSGGVDAIACMRLSATFSAHFLALLTADFKPFLPLDAGKKQDYTILTRPLLRYRLLEALKESMVELSEDSANGQLDDPYVVSLLVSFNVPHICLSLWKDPALLDIAFELIKQIVDQDPDEVLHLFVEGKPAIMSLFDLLNLDSSFETSKNVDEIRRFLASILGQLAESGLLAEAVERFEVRSSAIAALAAACLTEQERVPDEDEDMTSNQLSSVLMGCLVQLCTVKDQSGAEKKRIKLSAAEAEAIAKNLGRKMCHMVLSRFLERAKLQEYEMDEDESIMDAPDVAMLCAVAQHGEALKILRSIGGLHALSLVAAEGEMTAMVALSKACEDGADVILEGDAYLAIMNVLSGEKHETTWESDASSHRQVEKAAFELLARLCSGSAKGRNAVGAASSCQECVTRAIEIVSSLVEGTDDYDPATKPDDSSAESVVEGDAEGVDAEGETDVEEEAENETIDEPAPAIVTEGKRIVRQVSAEDGSLASAACVFLSAVVSTKIGRTTVMENTKCVKSLSVLARSNTVAELQFGALQLLSTLAPFATTDGALSMEDMSDALLSILISEQKIIATPTLNANLVRGTAVVGMNVVYDYLPADTQRSIAKAIATHFMKSVKSCSVTRAATKEVERAFAAEFSYNLSVSLLQIKGKESTDEVFTQDLMTSLIHLVQWRRDPKTILDNTNERVWDASVSNCLLLLSTALWRPDEILDKAGIDLKGLTRTTLMLARPGKAPRKAIDFKSALGRIIDSGDAASSVAAQRVVDRLF